MLMYEGIFIAGIGLVVLGVFAIIAYTLLNAIQPTNSSNTSFGGVVLIGPIPIVFGNSPGSLTVAELLAIVLIILAIIFFFMLSKR